MIGVTRVPNEQIRSYLAAVGVAGVFARYLVAQRPAHASPVVLDEHQRIVGAALSGRECHATEVYSHWVFANTNAAAQALATALQSSSVAINVPLLYTDTFRTVYPDATLSTDYLYLLPPSCFQPLHHDYAIVKLAADNLKELHIAAEIQPLLGALDDWTPETELYGIVSDGALIALGDMLVQDTQLAAIQQVYTLETWRGQGLAQALVSFLAGRIIAQGKVPLYVVAEDNLPSRRLAEKLGFKLDSCWGYLTSDGV